MYGHVFVGHTDRPRHRGPGGGTTKSRVGLVGTGFPREGGYYRTVSSSRTLTSLCPTSGVCTDSSSVTLLSVSGPDGTIFSRPGWSVLRVGDWCQGRTARVSRV